MTVKELIEELQKYNPDYRVVLYSHGRSGIEEEDEILGCYESEVFDEDDNVVEKVIELYEY